jgi:histidinol-phosphate aminotransferase
MYRPGMEQLPFYEMHDEPQWLAKLDANERSAPIRGMVKKQIDRGLIDVETRLYPDMTAIQLREMLAEAYGLSPEQVAVGNGSSELIAAICSSFGGSERPIAYQWPSFSMYPIYAAMADSPVVAVPLDEKFQLSVSMTLETVKKSGAKLLILCNPNNPTGGVIPAADLREIIRQVPCPVLVDEAYHEYCGETCLPWLAEFPNLMVVRTFSKAFGLAAARVGYLMASPEITTSIGKRMLPYHMNSFSLAAAQTCFANREFLMQEVRRTIKRRIQMQTRIGKLRGVEVIPSATNFLLVRVQKPNDLYDWLAGNGVGVRNLSHVPELLGCLRITIGNPVESVLVCQYIQHYSTSLPRTKGG